MPSARFEFPTHPAKLRLCVAAGIDADRGRILLRRALAHRRRLLVEHPEVFLSYLIFELMRRRETRTWVSLDSLHRSIPCEFVFRITTKLSGKLRIPILTLTSNSEGMLYNDSLYRFVGARAKELQPREQYRMARAERLQRQREAYHAVHGTLPESDGPRVYDGVAQRIQKANSHLRKQIVAGRAAALRRHARKRGLRKVTLQF